MSQLGYEPSPSRSTYVKTWRDEYGIWTALVHSDYKTYKLYYNERIIHDFRDADNNSSLEIATAKVEAFVEHKKLAIDKLRQAGRKG